MVLLHVLTGRVRVPELVVPVAGRVDLQYSSVRVLWQLDAHALDVFLALDTEPEAVIAPCLSRDGEDQVSRTAQKIFLRVLMLPRDAAQESSRSGLIALVLLLVEMELDVEMIDARVDVVHDVLEHDPDVVKLFLLGVEEGGVAGDVLADGPEDAPCSRLGSAGSEQLHAVDPDGADAVVLLSRTGGG